MEYIMYTLRKAYRVNRNGLDVHYAWDIFYTDEHGRDWWCNRYKTKKECIEALAKESIFL